MNIGASPPVECWNNGTMEQWVLGKWNIGNIPLENIVKSMRKDKFLQTPISL
jgi:hypothetical protein